MINRLVLSCDEGEKGIINGARKEERERER